MNFEAFLARMQFIAFMAQAMDQAAHQAQMTGGVTNALDKASAVLGTLTMMAAAGSQAFHAANGGTPVGSPVIAPQLPAA